MGTGGEGLEAAIQAALARARKTLCHLDWFEVKEYQVVLEVGVRLKE